MKKMAVLIICVLVSVFSLNAQIPPPMGVQPTDTDGNGIKNVSTLLNLQWITLNYNFCYQDSFELDNNIDASITQNWNGKFMPIGLNNLNKFVGRFYGKNHSISGLCCFQPMSDTIGFICSSYGRIKDLAITNCNIQGGNTVGAIVGANHGLIQNCSSSGTVTASGSTNLGGLVGYNNYIVKSSNSSATVSGGTNASNVGGLVGYNFIYNLQNDNILECYSTGSVTGNSNVGGLVGQHRGPSLPLGDSSRIYARIESCYSTSTVVGSFNVGGLAGWSTDHAGINNSYARGNVSYNYAWGTRFGGLVGYINNFSVINNSYSTGTVTAYNYIGGLVGDCAFSRWRITNSYWDTTTSGLIASDGGTGKITSAMQNFTTFTNWDFINIWDIESAENNNYPYLIFTEENLSIEPLDTDLDGFRNIRKLAHLRWITEDNSRWALSYELEKSFTARDTRYWNNGNGFPPIGNATVKFTGRFIGNGFTIDSLIINRPTQDYIGLFGYTDGPVLIENVALTNCQIIGNNYVGGVIGYLHNYSTNLNDLLLTARVDGIRSTGNVTGNSYVGGIIGKFEDVNNISPYCIHSFNNCSKVHAIGNMYVGGLIGYIKGRIATSYSRGEVTKTVGGNYVGGGFGYSYQGLIDKCYSTGYVSTGTGGLIGGRTTPATVTASYWDINTSGKVSSNGGRPETTDSMKVSTTFYNWDFISLWEINTENNGYPSFMNVPIYKRNIENNELNISTNNVDVDIYPNPVSADTKLIINLDQDINANIHIYNTLGQMVKNCYSGEILKGTKEINLNLQDLNNGSYYLIIENNSVLSCKAIIISR